VKYGAIKIRLMLSRHNLTQADLTLPDSWTDVIRLYRPTVMYDM